jgi:hypothetical protein
MKLGRVIVAMHENSYIDAHISGSLPRKRRWGIMLGMPGLWNER